MINIIYSKLGYTFDCLTQFTASMFVLDCIVKITVVNYC